MNEKTKNKLFFDVDSAEIIDDNPDSRFITCRIHVFSSGLNGHGLYCGEDALRKTASTIYNMPVIYNLVRNNSDFGTHTEKPDKSLICGFAIPDTATFEIVKGENGEDELGLFINAKIWKIYVPTVYEILEKRNGEVGISVEMWLYESHIREEDGIEEMDDFCYFGICLLGDSVRPAISNAELQVLSFSQINEKYQEDYIREFSKYSSLDFSISQEIKNNANKGLDLYKKYGIGGNSVALTIARHLSKNDKAHPEKIKSVHKYLLYHQNDSKKKNPPTASHINWMLYGGDESLEWSKDMVKKMKEIEDKPMSYFDDSEGEIINKKFLKKEELSVKDENEKELEVKEKTMAEEKLPETETAPEKETEEKMAEKTEEMAVEEKPESFEKKEDEEKETPAEEKSEEVEESEEKEDPKEEKMSLDANLDLAALMQMLVEETEDNKELADKYEAGEEMDYALLCSKLFAKVKKMKEESDAAKEDKDVYMAENASLKEYKDKIEKQQFDYAVEKTLQEVSDVFSKDEIDAAREEVKEFSVENLPAWQNDIKGKAFSRIKDNPKKKENFTRMATVSSWLNRDNESSEDVSKKYAKEGWLPKN